MITSAEDLHVHPLRMQPRDGTEAIMFYVSSPLDEARSPDGQTVRQEANKRAEARRLLPADRQEPVPHGYPEDLPKMVLAGFLSVQIFFRMKEYATCSKIKDLRQRPDESAPI